MDKAGFLSFFKGIHRPSAKLISLAPADKLGWRPADVNMMTLGQLLRHLADCPRHLATAARNAFPAAAEFARANDEALAKTAAPAEAGQILEANHAEAVKAIESLSEADFQKQEIAVPWGPPSPMHQALLAMAMHQSNHKMQLFLYLKILGLPVNTMTLYAGK
jgi:uncharacterized damage-inducible protein DinB